MRRILMPSACVTILAASLVQAQDDKTGEKWAVLIGINDYAHARDLKYCLADQRSLRDELTRSGFDARQVVLLEDDSKDKGLLPFKSNIEKQIELVCKLAQRGDLVMIGFSGHGLHIGKTSYWCPTDAKLDEPDSLISVDWVYEKLGKCKADLRLVMVDACRDVPPQEGGTRSFTTDELEENSRSFVRGVERLPEGLLLLNSCSEGEKSAEDEKFGHGVFMHFVLEGLRGRADKDKNGRVTLGELTSYASRETKLHVATKFVDSQRPKLKGNLTGEVLDFDLSTSRILEKTFKDSIGLSLTLIPAGEFEMGSPESPDDLLRRFPYAKREWFDGEQPVHKVTLTKSFYMGTYEVTLGQFLKFYHDASYKTDSEKDGEGGWGYDPNNKEKPFEQKAKYRPWSWGFEGQTNDHPAVNVSWNDAKAFCEWLSRKEGKTYRLPTEAEWEYACRAGTKSRYWNGNDPEELISIDNTWDDSAKSRFGEGFTNFLTGSDGYAFSAPVGRFKPNPFGLYDMHGNVSEWCEDWHGAYGKSAVDDPQGPTSGSSRVIRGGGWHDLAVDCRAAPRSEDAASNRVSLVGFRVVRVGE